MEWTLHFRTRSLLVAMTTHSHSHKLIGGMINAPELMQMVEGMNIPLQLVAIGEGIEHCTSHHADWWVE